MKKGINICVENNVVNLAKSEFKKRIDHFVDQNWCVIDYGCLAEDLVNLYGFRFDPMNWMMRNIADVKRAFDSLLLETQFKRELSSWFFTEPEKFLQKLVAEVLASLLAETATFSESFNDYVTLDKNRINILKKEI